MRHNTLLYELAQGEWLMEARYLHQMRESLRLDIAEKQNKEQQEANLLSFYNEDFKRISPENISDIPDGSIAVINIVGPMMKYGNYWILGADEVVAQLDFVNNLANIAGIVVNIDGPGGAVSAIPPFIEFSERKKKPVVALCDTSLSLHYWIPCAIADSIMAANTISSRFGSVGVYTGWMDYSEYLEKAGIKEHEVYPEESKHKNEVSRKMEKDETAAKKMLVDMHLQPLAQKFQAAVKAARPSLQAEEEGVLSGRTFGAEKALELGMIDAIGSMRQAMQVAQSLAEMKRIQ